MVLGSKAQRLQRHAVCMMGDPLREHSIHMVVMWPRSDEEGQISEHPLGGIWREKTPVMRMS